MQLTVPNLSCGTACNFMPADIARPVRNVGDGMPIYIAASFLRSGTDWDFALIKLFSDSVPDTNFAGTGRALQTFDQPGSDFGDFAAALAIDSSNGLFPDTLYVAGAVNRSCKTGTGLWKLDSEGVSDPNFGNINAGRALFGGSTETGIFCNLAFNHFPRDLALGDREVAVVGDSVRTDNISGTTVFNGFMLRANENSGASSGVINLALLNGNSSLIGVFPTEGGYYVSGQGATAQFPTLYITARLLAPEQIFSDGFE